MRPKKYTEAQFAEKVNDYFRRITRTVPLILSEPDLEETENEGIYKPRKMGAFGPEMRYTRAISDAGEQMDRTEYIIQPTISGLCLYLGISRETWNQYARQERYQRTVESARLRIETYLQDRLLEKNAARGAQFNLEHNFGWGKDADITEQPAPQRTENMSLRDKLLLLENMGLKLPEEEKSDDS